MNNECIRTKTKLGFIPIREVGEHDFKTLTILKVVRPFDERHIVHIEQCKLCKEVKFTYYDDSETTYAFGVLA